MDKAKIRNKYPNVIASVEIKPADCQVCFYTQQSSYDMERIHLLLTATGRQLRLDSPQYGTWANVNDTKNQPKLFQYSDLKDPDVATFFRYCLRLIGLQDRTLTIEQLVSAVNSVNLSKGSDLIFGIELAISTLIAVEGLQKAIIDDQFVLGKETTDLLTRYVNTAWDYGYLDGGGQVAIGSIRSDLQLVLDLGCRSLLARPNKGQPMFKVV